jgi:hypothetical protein
MTLITIAGDVFVASDVQAILTGIDEKTIRIVLRGRPETYDYDFDSERETRDVARAAVKILASAPAATNISTQPPMVPEHSVPSPE